VVDLINQCEYGTAGSIEYIQSIIHGYFRSHSTEAIQVLEEAKDSVASIFVSQYEIIAVSTLF
jgi:hypothetical protein